MSDLDQFVRAKVQNFPLEQLSDGVLDRLIALTQEIKEKRRQNKLNAANPNQYELFSK